MSDAVSEVQAWASTIGELASLPARLGPLAAPGIEAAAQAQIGAQTSPDGEPWAPTVDGEPALANAGSELSVNGGDAGVAVSLDGPSAFHNNGVGHSPRRQILPDDGDVPAAYAEAVDAAFAEAVG